MPSARVLAGLLATLAVAAAGCGGDDKPAPTKEQYVRQANATCKVANEKLTSSAVAAFAGAQPTEASIERYAKDSGFPTLDQLIKDLRALTPPEGDEDAVAGAYDALQGAVDKSKADPKLLTAPEETGPFKEANQKLNAYGLDACGAG